MGRLEDEPTQSIETSREAVGREREPVNLPPSSTQSGVCHRFYRAAERSPSECKTRTACWGSLEM